VKQLAEIKKMNRREAFLRSDKTISMSLKTQEKKKKKHAKSEDQKRFILHPITGEKDETKSISDSKKYQGQ
jgi:hypothetical protein